MRWLGTGFINRRSMQRSCTRRRTARWRGLRVTLGVDGAPSRQRSKKYQLIDNVGRSI
jgi:hypothetical protein